MIIQFVKLTSNLGDAELLSRAQDRVPQFQALPGLIQKYYVKLSGNTYGGIYIWDSQESLDEFRASDLAKTIPEAYEVVAPPHIEVGEVMFTLRE